jgi:hypothetical protein
MASRPIAANSANELGLGAQENQCSTEIGSQLEGLGYRSKSALAYSLD